MVSKRLIADFLDILPAVLYEYVLYGDGTGELLYITPSSKDILGYPPDYFVNDLNRFWAMVHPGDIDRLRHEDAEANHRNALFVSEVRLVLADGKEMWVQLSSRPTSEKKNDAVIWIGYLIDITRIKRIEMELLDANRQLKALAVTDGLTGLANRRHFDETLRNEWGRFQRTRKPFALIMIDIDFFKTYNDQYGHQRGDDCLKQVAAIVKNSARRVGDLAARYGGEEFIIIAFDTGLAGAMEMAETIRLAVAALAIKNDNTPLGKITISLGVSAIADGEYPSPDHLLKAADVALYQAKHDQRNCVRMASGNRQFLKASVTG